MATLQSYDPQSTDFHFKARQVVTVIAPVSVPNLTSLTEATAGVPTLKTLPAGWLGTGRTTRDGINFPRAVESEDQLSHGYREPSKSDTISDTTTINVTFQQANARVYSLYTGADLSALTPNATTGELWLPRPQISTDKYFRWLTIARDLDDQGREVFFGKYFPRVKVTEPGEQGFPGEGWVEWPVTLTSYFDSAAGTAVVDFFAGAGFKAGAAAQGFGSGA